MAVASESFHQLLGRLDKKECNHINHNIIGGLVRGEVIEITGGHISGATSLLCNLALLHLKSNPSSHVIYIDCDRGVNPIKFEKLLCDMDNRNVDSSNILNRLILSSCNNNHEIVNILSEVVQGFRESSNHADLVLVDNILSFYWNNIYDKNVIFDKVVSNIKKIKDNCAVVLSKHPPIKSTKQLESMLPCQWSKIVTRKFEVINQNNPRNLIDLQNNSLSEFSIDSNGLLKLQ